MFAALLEVSQPLCAITWSHGCSRSCLDSSILARAGRHSIYLHESHGRADLTRRLNGRIGPTGRSERRRPALTLPILAKPQRLSSEHTENGRQSASNIRPSARRWIGSDQRDQRKRISCDCLKVRRRESFATGDRVAANDLAFLVQYRNVYSHGRRRPKLVSIHGLGFTRVGRHGSAMLEIESEPGL